MVGPVSDEERSAFLMKVKVGFVLLVGLSGGLISLQTDAGMGMVAAAVVGGFVVGAVLVAIAFPSSDDLDTRSDSQRSRR